MSVYLLDTNVILFVMEDDRRLTARAREAVAQGKNVISVVSYWEVTLNTMKGNLDVGNLRAWWAQALLELAAPAMPIRPEHIEKISHLPPIHKDPFDRILIAQAIAEDLILITTDTKIPLYASQNLKVIS